MALSKEFWDDMKVLDDKLKALKPKDVEIKVEVIEKKVYSEEEKKRNFYKYHRPSGLDGWRKLWS